VLAQFEQCLPIGRFRERILSAFPILGAYIVVDGKLKQITEVNTVTSVLGLRGMTMIRKRNIKDIPARFQIEMKREELDELERLRILGGLGSKKELLNNALTLLKWATRQRQQGYSIAVVSEDGHIVKELEMPYLESVAHAQSLHASAVDDQRQRDGRSTHSKAVPTDDENISSPPKSAAAKSS
jgi:hypothetical protein